MTLGKGSRIRVVVVPLLVAAAVSALLLLGRLEKFELIAVDLRFSLLSRPDPSPLTLVAIDQNALKEVGVWPWPRRVYGALLDALARDGARCLLVDIDFSSRSGDPEADRSMVDAVARSVPTFLAMFEETTEGEGGYILHNLSIPFPELAEASAGVGNIVFEPDADGTVRRMPRDVPFGDGAFPPLSLLGARVLEPSLAYDPPPGALIAISPETVATIPVVSFADVAAGRVPPGTFRDRVVLLGPTSLDLGDIRGTAVGTLPGVYLHAAALETSLNRSWLVRPPRWAVLLMVLGCSAVLGLAMGRSGWKGGAVILCAFLAAVAAAAFLLLRGNVLLDVVPILLVGLVQFPSQVALHARRTEEVLDLEKRRTDAILKRSELEDAEETGRQPYVVPLVLLRQVLGLDTVRLFLLEEEGGGAWREDAVIGEADRPFDAGVLGEVIRGGELVRARSEGGGASVYVPLRTVRRTLGILFVSGPPAFEASDADLRLLLSYATQTAYFLESKELAQKMKEEETVRTNLARYLSPQIVEQIIADKVQVNLGGARKVVTVLFSDIRNFTTISETMPPDVLVAILNDYFTEMASIIFSRQGSLDKYIGDAIVAVFGSLIAVENPALNATQAAVDMMRRLPELNRRWGERYDGFSMSIGIGINTGEVFLGNIGSMERMEFTVIGDTVNVASRFSGLAKPMQILLTEMAQERVGEGLPTAELPPTAVKGKSEMLRVFEVRYAADAEGRAG